MDEVQDLLKQAWNKAYENGVVLSNVRFELHETYCGNLKLGQVRIDAKLRNRDQDE